LSGGTVGGLRAVRTLPQFGTAADGFLRNGPPGSSFCAGKCWFHKGAVGFSYVLPHMVRCRAANRRSRTDCELRPANWWAEIGSSQMSEYRDVDCYPRTSVLVLTRTAYQGLRRTPRHRRALARQPWRGRVAKETARLKPYARVAEGAEPWR